MRNDSLQVTEMVASRLSAGREHETVVSFPSHLQVEEAVMQLDGTQFSDLYLYRYPRNTDAETFLGICGGAGRYFVGISDHAERIGQLINTEDPSDEEECIKVGGQPTSIARRFLVGLQTTMIAATHYLDTGQAAPALDWDWR